MKNYLFQVSGQDRQRHRHVFETDDPEKAQDMLRVFAEDLSKVRLQKR